MSAPLSSAGVAVFEEDPARSGGEVLELPPGATGDFGCDAAKAKVHIHDLRATMLPLLNTYDDSTRLPPVGIRGNHRRCAF